MSASTVLSSGRPRSGRPGRPGSPTLSPRLTTARGAALYIGALLGPGLLLLPGLAAAEAGPASLLAWVALLVLSALFAVVFAALGLRFPSAAGVIGYVTAGLGARAGLTAGWSFVAGVVAGAPVICLIGAGYVTELTGGGRLAQTGIAALLLLTVLALAAGGLRTTTAAQLVLVGLLIGVVTVAVAGSARWGRTANWTPFAPHGWLAVGQAAATLMLSFVGWEAVAPLTTQFTDPARQLPRVVAVALAVTSTLYLGLAIVTIGVLGSGGGTMAPLVDLLRRAIGPAGTAAGAVAAIVLTLGAVNAYVNGAAAMTGRLLDRRPAAAAWPLADEGDGHRTAGFLRLAARSVPRRASGPAAAAAQPQADAGPQRPGPVFLAAITVSGLALLALYGLGLVSPVSLVAIPTTLFLAVYLGSMLAAARVLRGPARLAAVPAAGATAVMLGYCGWALAVPALIALVVRASGSIRRWR